jgi:hypothetical protein
LKAQINAAIKEEHIVRENPYSKFKLPYEHPQRVFLRKNELLKAGGFGDTRATWCTWRRSGIMFLLSCYTGLQSVGPGEPGPWPH